MTAKDLFANSATLEYRVVPSLDGGAQWHWVLINALDKVIGGGTAPTRGKAGALARRRALQMRKKVTSIRVAGLVEGKVPNVRSFIERMSSWMVQAEKLGYMPTQDAYWTKAAHGEPIYARVIECSYINYTISIFGGEGKAKGGGLLVWVSLDALDTHNENRMPLRNFLTSEKKLPFLLSTITESIYTYTDDWGALYDYLGNLAQGIVEAKEDPRIPDKKLETNPAKDFILDIPSWQERCKKWSGGWGPRAYYNDDPKMVKTAKWDINWSYDDFYMSLDLLVHFDPALGAQVPRSLSLRGEYVNTGSGSLVTQWLNTEELKITGDPGMNEFVDQLEPAINTLNEWYAQKKRPTHWEFAQLIARVQSWMTNHPQMQDYI